jgi:hypothetical protein
MTDDVLVAPLRLRMPALWRALEREGLSVVVVAAWVAVLAGLLSSLFVSDTWLAFVDGRYVAHHGLPHHDTLTAWTRGVRWTDQQWGAHLALYGATVAGGLVLAAVLGLACVGLALTLVVIFARQLGASPRSAALAVMLPLVAAPWLAQVRTQTLVLPLFVLVFGLLALDARRPGRRVLWVLPVLVLWANLHGSVSLAAGLVFLYGLTRRRWGLLAAPLALVASPYGLALVSYYRLMLLHPPLASVVTEWRPVSLEAATVPFFVTAFVGTALWARHRRVLTAFEQWALPLLLVAALAAVRNAVWFELAFAVALPRWLDAVWQVAEPPPAVRRANAVLACVAILGSGIVLLVHVDRGAAQFEQGGAAAVAAAAGPHGLVIADDRHADWLLWEEPQLAGRVAYDVRFELFTGPQLQQIVDLDHGLRGAWARCGSTATVVTFHSAKARQLLVSQRVLNPGAHLVVDENGFGAFAQEPKQGACHL